MKKGDNSASGHSLESLKLYPYVAWILIIGFTVFVYNITTNLKAAASDLRIQTEISSLEQTHISNPKNKADIATSTVKN